jgi:hypothetical protein
MKSIFKIEGKNLDDHSYNKLIDICGWEENKDEKYLSILPINDLSRAHEDILLHLQNEEKLKHLKENKSKILIFLTDQGDPRNDKRICDKFGKIVDDYDLSETSISFLTCEAGDYRIPKLSLLEYNFPLTEFYTSNLDTLDLTEEMFKYVSSKKHKRPNKFCCFNGSFKNHRTILFYELLKNNLIEKNSVSYTCYDKFENGIIDKSELIDILGMNDKYVDMMFDLLPYCTDSVLKDANSGVHTYDINIVAHFSSYFNLCTSSGYGGFPYLDDKTYKPILTFQPFIIVGEKNSLETMRKVGFKTFDDWIDESYDFKDDYRERIRLITTEVKRICGMSIEEIDYWYRDMYDILYHNFNHMKKIFDSRVQGKRINKFVDDLFINTKSSYLKIYEGYDE